MTSLHLQIPARAILPVDSIEQASRIYSDQREASGEGGSTFPTGLIFDETGSVTHHVSYNGKVWLGQSRDWTAETELAFNPFESATA